MLMTSQRKVKENPKRNKNWDIPKTRCYSVKDEFNVLSLLSCYLIVQLYYTSLLIL